MKKTKTARNIPNPPPATLLHVDAPTDSSIWQLVVVILAVVLLPTMAFSLTASRPMTQIDPRKTSVALTSDVSKVCDQGDLVYTSGRGLFVVANSPQCSGGR